ncbi:MAG: mechanosensitive ion channel family protein [Anaerocolumna sp.]|jgi:small-conductance mechanosensitive channel|nr:mechanosensitive ion channel family protein [Anaerocolumna sp.]
MSEVYITIVIIILTLVLNKFNKLLFKGILKRRNKIHLKFLRSIISVFIYAMGIYGILLLFGFTEKLASSLVTSSSIIVAVAIFAAQESLNDILSGVMLSWSKPFEIGERVQIIGLNITGIVEDITVRHTIIRTFNHAKVVVPNSVLNKQVIENNSNVDSRAGNFLDIIISYESDLNKAISILEELVSTHQLVLKSDETPVKVMIRDLAENGIALRVQVWTKEVSENFSACSDLRKSVLEKFKENNIEIPYKQIKVVNS